MQFTGTSNNVLTGFRDVGQDTRVRLGQPLQTLDQLGQVIGVLDLDSDLNDRGHGEFHNFQVVGSLGSGKGTRLEQELINTDQTADVTGWNIFNGLNVTTHHKNGSLNGLDEQILFPAGGVVRSLDADLKTRLDGTGEDTAKSVEATLIGSWHHFGDVQHERSLGVTVANTNAGFIVGRTLVQSLSTVPLSSHGRRQVHDDHLHESIGSRQELPHDNLEEGLPLKVPLLGLEGNLELLEQYGDLVLLEVHDSREDPEDGVQNELIEGTFQSLALVHLDFGPFLCLRVEEVVALRI